MEGIGHWCTLPKANRNRLITDPPLFKGSEAPATDTKLEDVEDELPDHVISRSGTPNQWAFDDKEPSLKTAPPRPTSATCCTPPVPRKVNKYYFLHRRFDENF